MTTLRGAGFIGCVILESLLLLLVGCGGAGNGGHSSSPTVFVAPGLAATTTLAAETGNNTSTSDAFAAQSNGNAGAGSVSKAPIRSLLYAGATTKIFAHLMAWFGGTNHINVGYQSDDPAQVHRQIEDMISRGIDGAIIVWSGPASTRPNNTANLLKQEAEAHQGFEFAIEEDVSAVGAAAHANHCDATDQVLSDLNTIASQFQASSAYMRVNGRPAVFLFGVDAYFIDWNRVTASVPGGALLLFRGTRPFTSGVGDGGFQWLDMKTNDPFDPQLAAQDAFYAMAKANPGRYAMGSAYKGFNDSVAPWGLDRMVHQRCGQTWLATFSEVSKFYSSGNQLPALQLVTWNDYEEGTAMEMGIDNCVCLTPTISGNVLSWAVAGGNENSIDHYAVFITADGQNMAKLADVPAGAHSFDLSRVSLPASTFTLYVEAVGRASIQNKFSPAIAYHPGDQQPAVSLAVTQNGMAVTASTAGSSDPDGTVGNSTIDFGDGTVATGPKASHTYTAVGPYNITATLFDNVGASAVAVKRVSAKPAAPGVTILSPANGATVNWPTTLLAAANAANPVTTMKVLVDGQPIYATEGDSINTSLKIFRGPHQVSVQATDIHGATTSSTINVTAEPGDLSPTAVVNVLPMTQVAPNTVLVCTAGSKDPDGFLTSTRLQFSDGTTAATPGALHTFAAPGTYSVTATVTDQFGATGSASQTFVVSGSAKNAAPVNPQPASTAGARACGVAPALAHYGVAAQ